LKARGIERTQLHYKSRNFTEEQIDEQLLYAKFATTLKSSYTESFGIYTKYQLKHNAYVQLTPHLLLRGKSDTTPDYLLDYFPAFTASWRLRRRINQHDVAADESETIYPHLLLVAGNTSTERRLVQFTEELYADFEVFVTTTERLLSGEKKIWLIPVETNLEDEELEYHALPLKLP
jgi:hypothetical protein